MFYRTISIITYISIIWSAVPGKAVTENEPELYGSISILSMPSNAVVFLNGKETGYKTPTLLTKVKAGLNTIKVILPDYLFAKRQINIIPDTTISLSFKLILLSDTAHIIGNLQLGILSLPRPPVYTPYLVDNKQVYSEEITLNAGRHQIVWEGGNIYASLDTIVEIFPGKLTTFSFSPERLTGRLTISPFPYDADIYINNRLNSTGELHTTLATGTYTIAVQRNGYNPHQRQVRITPGRHLVLEIDLEQIPDRDQDGFLDSCDQCPDVYGLYSGCPEQNRGEAVKRYMRIVRDNMNKQPLTFSINTIGYIYRNPTSAGFKEFISYFNDGNIICNNRNGLIFANTYTASYHGFHFSVELGQWYSRLEYKKYFHNPILITTEEDQYYIFYKDSVTGLEPSITLPSTAVSCGFNLTIRRFNCTYSIGYQWEDIIISDIISKAAFEQILIQTDSLVLSFPYTGPRPTIVFDNNYWFHKLRFEFDFAREKRFLPAIYASIALPIGSKQYTGWHTIQAGMLYKFIPSVKRNSRSVIKRGGNRR